MLRPTCFVSDLIAIVRPRAELLARARELEGDLDELFAEPVCLKARYGGLTTLSFAAYTHRWAVRIKAGYLARLVADHRDPSNPWLDDLIGATQVDVAVFDRWWTLEIYGNVEDLVEAAEAAAVVEVAPEDREWFVPGPS